MGISNIFNTNFSYTDEEYELKLQNLLANSVLKTVVLMLLVLSFVRLFQENYIQLVTDVVFMLISIAIIFYVARDKHNIQKLSTITLTLFFPLVMISFYTTNMSSVGASWFIVYLLPAFYFGGSRVGIWVAIASIVSVVILGNIKDETHTLFDSFYILLPLVIASILIYLYEVRILAAKELLKFKNISLKKEVDIKIQEEIQLLQEKNELADVISKSEIELFIVDYDSDMYLYVNKGGLEALGYTLQEIIKMSVYDTNPALTVEEVNKLKSYSATTKNIMNISQHQRKDGSVYGVQSFIHEMLYKGKKAYAIYDINLSDQQRAQNELLKQKEDLLQQAHYDSLTKLPNRVLFNDRLTQAIAKSNRHKKDIAVLFIDLDKFKEVNDTLGHKVGDSVLCEVSSRFKMVVREVDTISRFGGDEFVCIIEDLDEPSKAAVLARKLIDAIRIPIKVNQHTINLTCSIGISIYKRDAKDATELLHHSDSAMYRAKDSGKDMYQFYENRITSKL